MSIILKKFTSEDVLRKALYIVAIVSIALITIKVVWGTITTRQYNYGEESEFIRKIEQKYGL